MNILASMLILLKILGLAILIVTAAGILIIIVACIIAVLREFGKK